MAVVEGESVGSTEDLYCQGSILELSLWLVVEEAVLLLVVGNGDQLIQDSI